MKKPLNEEDVRKLVRAEAKRVGTRTLADRIGVSPSYVSLVCTGKSHVGPRFLKMLGLKKVVLYVVA